MSRVLVQSWVALLLIPTILSTAQFRYVLPFTYHRHCLTVYDNSRVIEIWKAMEQLKAPPRVATLLAPLIHESARQYQVDPLIMVSIGYQESRFRLGARGSRGEVGVFQIMPRAWVRELRLTEEELSRPAANTQACAHILSKYLRSYGSYKKAVKAYNHRIHGARYSRSVLSRYRKLAGLL